MTFESESANKAFKLNVIVEIASLSYEFAQFTPDSGLTPSHVGYIGNAKINPISLDIRSVSTTTSTLNFDLIDLNGVISDLIMADDNNFLEREVTLKVGFMTTAGFPYSSYRTFASSKIKSWQKSDSVYKFTCNDVTELIKEPYLDVNSNLSAAITDSATSMTLDDSTGFAASGRVKVNDEMIQYTTNTTSTGILSGLSRADLSGVASAHDSGDKVSEVTTLQDNPIDMMTDIFTALGVNSSVDLTSFSAIKAAYFPSDTYRVYAYDIENALEFIEDHVLLPINCRLAPVDGKITLIILDQVDLTTAATIVNEDSITQRQPEYKASSKRIINQVEIQWNYSEGLAKYTRTSLYPTTGTSDSIVAFGAKKPLKLKFKGVAADLNGATIVAERATRLLARTERPITGLKFDTHMDKSALTVGDDIRLQHRYLPQQGAGLNFDATLEVMSQGFDFLNGLVSYSVEFTSASGIRLGQIAPSPLISSVTSQSVFDVPDGDAYAAGYILDMDGESQTILSVSTNTITMISAYSVTTLTTSIRVKFPDYDLSSDGQKLRYCYQCPDSNVFVSDGLSGYQVFI